ncbi:hypothetical protein BD770DRAFT_409185 [Pilaira anomala]|nr:hypothetical protein BD770DRAFT_409185 [Pilaira anomala]
MFTNIAIHVLTLLLRMLAAMVFLSSVSVFLSTFINEEMVLYYLFDIEPWWMNQRVLVGRRILVPDSPTPVPSSSLGSLIPSASSSFAGPRDTLLPVSPPVTAIAADSPSSVVGPGDDLLHLLVYVTPCSFAPGPSSVVGSGDHFLPGNASKGGVVGDESPYVGLLLSSSGPVGGPNPTWVPPAFFPVSSGARFVKPFGLNFGAGVGAGSPTCLVKAGRITKPRFCSGFGSHVSPAVRRGFSLSLRDMGVKHPRVSSFAAARRPCVDIVDEMEVDPCVDIVDEMEVDPCVFSVASGCGLSTFEAEEMEIDSPFVNDIPFSPSPPSPPTAITAPTHSFKPMLPFPTMTPSPSAPSPTMTPSPSAPSAPSSNTVAPSTPSRPMPNVASSSSSSVPPAIHYPPTTTTDAATSTATTSPSILGSEAAAFLDELEREEEEEEAESNHKRTSNRERSRRDIRRPLR